MVSLEVVFARVKSYIGINDVAINVSDWVEWASDAMLKVGAFPQYVQRITGVRDLYGYDRVLTIENWQTEVPCDLHSIIQIAYSPTSEYGYSTCRAKTGFFDIRNLDLGVSNSSGVSTTVANATLEKVKFVSDVFQISQADAYARLNTEQHLNSVLDMAFGVSGGTQARGMLTDVVYEYAHPYLRFSMKDGYAIVAYNAIPVDENGYPMIPDDNDLIDAIFWFINSKELYKEYRSHVEGAKDLYLHADNEWKKARLLAYGNLMMPKGLDELRTVQNIWLRMIPKLSEHHTGYKDTGTTEKLFNRF